MIAELKPNANQFFNFLDFLSRVGMLPDVAGRGCVPDLKASQLDHRAGYQRFRRASEGVAMMKALKNPCSTAGRKTNSGRTRAEAPQPNAARVRATRALSGATAPLSQKVPAARKRSRTPGDRCWKSSMMAALNL